MIKGSNDIRVKIEHLWDDLKFKPNPNQEAAIKHINGPLYLPAGPGSGKTRVLLWRTLNLIVFHNVNPKNIYLSTFTGKAALQLREGIRTYLAYATRRTHKPYDIAKLYVGTVHSSCQRMMNDRRFSLKRKRPRPPSLLDELGQYFYIYRDRIWREIVQNARNPISRINECFEKSSISKHAAVLNCISLFNRFSEECINPKATIKRIKKRDLRFLSRLYCNYLDVISSSDPRITDFSLLQQAALDAVQEARGGDPPFQYIIVDEYQDTNPIQERLFFELAKRSKNICIVGDDDQALYRFRGATVENFVEFPNRCCSKFSCRPKVIQLVRNYRSRRTIVDFYKTFIEHPTCNWQKQKKKKEYHRVVDKKLHAERKDNLPAVIASTPCSPEQVCKEIAKLVKSLIDKKKVEDPNQIAFLFPSLGSSQVPRMIKALEELGLKVYAPRAGSFLEVEEARTIFGLFQLIFGQPDDYVENTREYLRFSTWLDTAVETAKSVVKTDPLLKKFINLRLRQVAVVIEDYRCLVKTMEKNGWSANTIYEPDTMCKPLALTKGISRKTQGAIKSKRFDRIVRTRLQRGNQPFTLQYIVNRAASVDWTILDMFYQLCSFKYFRRIFDLAASGKDEGPICNLSLISQYLSRFMDEYIRNSVITGQLLTDGRFKNILFRGYLYTLFRLDISEYENPEDPFPKGRIPFITIHQAKGLEFPVVVLGNPRKRERLQPVEEIIQPLIKRQGEPINMMPIFDVRRMFYVAISRPKNLLIIAHYKGRGQSINEPFKSMLGDDIIRIPDFDIETIPRSKSKEEKLPKTYSYTGDYLLYHKCPRQYMIYRKYEFTPSRSQTMFFGSLVHHTIEDLHQYIMRNRSKNGVR